MSLDSSSLLWVRLDSSLYAQRGVTGKESEAERRRMSQGTTARAGARGCGQEALPRCSSGRRLTGNWWSSLTRDDLILRAGLVLRYLISKHRVDVSSEPTEPNNGSAPLSSSPQIDYNQGSSSRSERSAFEQTSFLPLPERNFRADSSKRIEPKFHYSQSLKASKVTPNECGDA